MSSLHRSKTAKRLTMLVALLGVLGVAAGLALASGAPPAPRITAHPPARTRNRRVNGFRFSDSQANVSFSCSLDGSPYAACTSPKGYALSRPGRNVFRVRARDASGAVSRSASYSWAVDLVAPQITVAFPVDGGIDDPASWVGGCANGSGLCGTVRAPSGIKSVIVWIRRDATGRYWDGRAFSSRDAIYQDATVTPRASKRKRVTRAGWLYTLPFPVTAGSYTVRVRATDQIGNVTRLRTQRTISFSISTTQPPAPAITAGPSDPSSSAAATFTFTDGWREATFECSLDGQAWTPCQTGVTYTGLQAGAHVFAVRARDPAGDVSQGTQFPWTITAASSGPFTIRGNAVGRMYPGAPAQQVPLTITNPNSVAIDVTSLTAAIDESSLPAGCSSSGYELEQTSIPSAGIAVPAGGSVTLPAQGATTASIQMLDLAIDQDACQNAQLTLTYSGSASS